MSRRILLTVLALAGGALAFLLFPVGQAISQQISQVLVVNWPNVLNVEGQVTLDEPVRLARQEEFLEVVVPPVKRGETTRLVDAGRLVTQGFPSVVLSLHGEVRGQVKKPGSVGVILIPDETSIQDAFHDQGKLHFALEAVAEGIDSRTPYFASNQPRFTVAFSTYRVLIYNTTDKTVTANLFAYLTQ
jgi:hypothetical protein